jgi:hypothetical protein
MAGEAARSNAVVGVILALALLSVAVATLVPAHAFAAKQKKSKCQRLKGTDQAPAKKVKLIAKRNGDGGSTLRGCVLPRGRVRTIARSADFGTTSNGYDVVQVAGVIVLVRYSAGSQYESSESVSVWNLRTGAAYGVADFCARLGGGTCGSGMNTQADAVFVNTKGQAAAVLTPVIVDSSGLPPGGVGPTVVAGFTSRGKRCELDSSPTHEIPPASLRLTGVMAAWTNGGTARSAAVNGCVV